MSDRLGALELYITSWSIAIKLDKVTVWKKPSWPIFRVAIYWSLLGRGIECHFSAN